MLEDFKSILANLWDALMDLFSSLIAKIPG